MKRKTSTVIAAVALSLAACAAGTRVIVFIDLASFIASADTPTDASALRAILPSEPISFEAYFLPGYEIRSVGEGPSEALQPGYPVVFPVPKHAATDARLRLRVAGSITVTPAPFTNTELAVGAVIAPAGTLNVYADGDEQVLEVESEHGFTVKFEFDWEAGTDSLVDEILASGKFRIGVFVHVQIEQLAGFGDLDPDELEVRYDIEFLFVEITAYPIDFLP
ncbi:MAG: hypothetical protein EA426_16510 [Spirochaetaceae bacterium]|nr:MAG: hypothetical protein EA426_16510 [Spirochaetaceae bacterium]